MGRIRSFDIRFDNRARIYHAGELLNGQVLLDLRESSYVQRIEVDVYSKPCLRYMAGTGCCTTVFSEAELLSERVTIFPSSSSLDEEAGVSLRAGSHSFNFSIPLPANIPSSFECKFSKVQYYVVAEVELAGSRALQEKTKAPFKVINSVDLLMFPHTQLSQQRHARVNISPTPLPVLGSQTGPLEVRFHINKGGYIPGEKVKIYGEITNNTAVQVRKSYVELIQEVRLRSNQKVKTVRSPVTGLRHHSIPPGESDIWDTDCLTIPDLPPSTLNQNSGNIRISYLLQLVVVPGGLSQKVKLPIEITMGTGLGMTSTRAASMSERFQDDRILQHLSPSSRHSVTLPEDPNDQFLDIINQEGGRITLHVLPPPPYSPYDEPPPPYQEVLDSDS